MPYGALSTVPARRLRMFVVALVAAGAVAATAVAAVVSQQVIADTDNVHLRIVRTTVKDGFDSGWHVHPGIVFVQVQQGSLQLYQGGCTPVTIGPGQMVAEVPHLAVRAIASGSASFTVTLVTSSYDPVQIGAKAYYGDPGFNPCPSLP